MSEIIVRITEPTDQRRLIYRRDPEIEPTLIFLSSIKNHKTIYSMNINDGAVIIGADDCKKIINLEIGIPQSRWEESTNLSWPTNSRIGDIEFSNLNSPHSEYSTQTKVFRNSDFGLFFLQIGTSHGEILGVSLSEQCMAGVIGNVLIGFFVNRAIGS